ncbi:hypothetical protein ACFE04_012295 [Oxalis oulophora]
MPSISSPCKEIIAGVRSSKTTTTTTTTTTSIDVIIRSNVKRKLISNDHDDDSSVDSVNLISSPRWKSPRRCVNAKVNAILPKSPLKKSTNNVAAAAAKLNWNWNLRDAAQVSVVKEALHVSTAPATVLCREDEQRRVLDFCKQSIERQKAGSIYVCGCPGTGKSLSMDKIKKQLIDWTKEAGFQTPDVLSLNCTTLTNASEIFSKILGKDQARKKAKGSTSPLKNLQNLYSQEQSFGSNMMVIVADELDYLITRDSNVLHDLFMLTTLPFSRCILIGVANAIDLADRFLPRLQSLNCKPTVITFRAYSKDQILRILQERLTALPYNVFQPLALELCARKVAAASGDMRKALSVCRSALEILEGELREFTNNDDSMPPEKLPFDRQIPLVSLKIEEAIMVKIDHMAAALSRTFRSPIVDTIQSLPLHQQIILCSAVKFLRGVKKDTTVGELYKSYMEISKSVGIPPAGILEFSSMCRVLNDQGLLKLGQSREEKSKRVTLKIDESDITFALQGIRLFRECLQPQ